MLLPADDQVPAVSEWVFEKADHLSPDDLIEELLSDEAAVVANRATEFPPTIGANALVVVNLACAGLRR